MRRARYLLCACLLASGLAAQSPAEHLAKTMEGLPYDTQLAVAVVSGDSVDYYGAEQTPDGTRTVRNEGTRFEIGSITKVFTATVLARLATAGELEMENDINDYYPFVFKDSIRLRFRDLSNHSAGLFRLPSNLDLSNVANPYANYDSVLLENYLTTHLTLADGGPGNYGYSNLGAGLLGYTLGRVRSVDFRDLLRAEVLKPYGLNHTQTGPAAADSNLVGGRGRLGEAVANWDFGVLFGAGGLRSTARDLARFARAHFDATDAALALTREPTLTVNNRLRLGLGWHILSPGEGKAVRYWHNGGTGGYTSSLMVDPAGRRAVVVLSNLSAFNPETGRIDRLAAQLMDATE